MTKKLYRTATGKLLDFEALALKNEKVNAVGNNPVNARGDEIGPGGKIVRTKQEVIEHYYKHNPKAASKVSGGLQEDTFEKPKTQKTKKKQTQTKSTVTVAPKQEDESDDE